MFHDSYKTQSLTDPQSDMNDILHKQTKSGVLGKFMIPFQTYQLKKPSVVQ